MRSNGVNEQATTMKGDSSATMRKEVVVEDACTVFRLNTETGDIEICPRGICEPEKADPEIKEKLLQMATEMQARGGKLRLVFESEQ